MQRYWYDLTAQQWADMTPVEWSEFLVWAKSTGLIVGPIDFPARLKERIETAMDIGLNGSIEISATHQVRISGTKRAVVIS